MKPNIFNQSDGQWAFQNLARTLSNSLWTDISENVGSLNYILCIDPKVISNDINSFIPIESIAIALDKREIEIKFRSYGVTRPKTFILKSVQEVDSIIARYDRNRWVLKYPIGCGGSHHRIIENSSQIPRKWPKPFLIQEFIESIQPEVYRFYCVDGNLFGFNARRFSSPEISSPWVSHANGAGYSYGDVPNQEVIDVAKASLIATGLYDSFGVVDLVHDRSGKWYALEVGTDGIYNHVDRDIENDDLLHELNERIAVAFWRIIGMPPWGKSWKYRDVSR
jgi:hypothetical protein